MGEIDEAELTRAGQRGAVVEGMTEDGKRTVPGALLRRCCHELKDQIGTLALRGQLSRPERRSLVGGTALTVDGDVVLDGLRMRS